MNIQEIDSYVRILIIASVSFFVVFILCVCLYFKVSFIQEIILFLLLIHAFSLLFIHDELAINKVYLISVINALIVFLLVVVTGNSLKIDLNKWVLCVSMLPFLFLVFYKVLNMCYSILFKTSPLLNSIKAGLDKHYFYFLGLLYVPIIISYMLYDVVKLNLF
ncbi:hypothetical protein CW732_15635 [Olleya sp. Bg11-27]|nr:hypothetical protein CW732_15635 [Olleya sp. Bg11-27]